jgi:hypothetical protein
MAAMGMVIVAAAAQGAAPYLIGVAIDEMITTGNSRVSADHASARSHLYRFS